VRRGQGQLSRHFCLQAVSGLHRILPLTTAHDIGSGWSATQVVVP
jgi:hypothetical protein